MLRAAIPHRVRLEDSGGQVLGNLGHVRLLEGAGRDHDLVGSDRSSAGELEPETPVPVLLELLDLAVELDRQLEGLGVALEEGDYLVPRRIAVGIAGEGKARQRAVAARREERQ